MGEVNKHIIKIINAIFLKSAFAIPFLKTIVVKNNKPKPKIIEELFHKFHKF